MDLSKLLTQSEGATSVRHGSNSSESTRHGSNSSVNTETEENVGVEKEGQWRDRMYKRKNMKFDTTSTERRTLKSLQASERRKSSRQSHQFAGRNIEAQTIDESEENEENDPKVTVGNQNKKTRGSTQKVKDAVEPSNQKQLSRKEKLAAYLDQKKKLETAKRRNTKPAFKVGVVHHPMAPIGAGFHKPNVFSAILNNSRSTAAPSPKVVSKVVKSKVTTASVTGRVTRSKAAGVPKSKQLAQQQAVTPSLSSAAKKTKTPKERKVRASFAPDNFEFRLNLPLKTVTEEPQESGFNEEEAPETSTPVKMIDEPANVVIEDSPPKVSAPSVPTEEAATNIPEVSECTSMSPEPVPEIYEQAQSRGRRRSRRISGVQPDPTLTQEDLCLTPAKRAKDRSASRDRRSAMCNLCPGEHSCATPRATPRISRKSTLPALTEVGSGEDITEPATADEANMTATTGKKPEVEVVSSRGRRSTRRSVRNLSVNETASSDVVRTPDKLANLARMAVDIPLPTTEKKGRSRRSLKVQNMEVDITPQVQSFPEVEEKNKSGEIVGTPISTLSKTMDKASLESTKKEATFKTPLKSARKAGFQSASKNLGSPSWITTSRGSSKRKRNESPSSYSVPDMFENLEGSPLLAKLEKKLLSNENISEDDFVEEAEFVPAAKQVKLDHDFEEIAEECSKESADKACNGEVESDKGVLYFRNLVAEENDRLTKVCDGWEKKLEDNISCISDDIQGEIRSVIGQGRLVMAERFGQFSGLVDNCEFKRGEKETTCTDLMGFWEMIYFQVEDVDKKFTKLSEIESNNWAEIVKKPATTKKKIVKKPVVGAGPKKAASSGLKALIAAKRKAAEEAKAALSSVPDPESNVDEIAPKIVEEKTEPKIVEEKSNLEEENPVSRRLTIKEMIAKKRAQLAKEKAEKEAPLTVPKITTTTESESADDITFEGGFFSVASPARQSSISRESSPKQASPSPSRKSRKSVGDNLRKSVLKDTTKRMSGLVSPFVSQVARRSLQGNLDAQPTELFKDIDKNEHKEADEIKIATGPLIELFDPIAPLSSPVTKTYSKSGASPAAKQRQIDAFDQMVVGTSPKQITPAVNFTENVELISFDSPAESVVSGAISDNIIDPQTPTMSKSKIPVKTPSRRSMRVAHTPK